MLKILDCTFRDGGYYVNWSFDESLVKKYLSAVAITKVDIIELGFRFLSKDKFLGAFAYTSDEYLMALSLPKNLSIAVMINADEIICRKDCGVRNTVNQLFRSQSESPVSIVRVAVHVKDVNAARDIVDELKSLGYQVFLNLMQIDSVSSGDIVEISSQIESWRLVDVLYFADSFGSMDPDRIEEVVDLIASEWKGSIGVHAHDNKGHALQNTLRAHECGVEYLDGTLSGMGRGAGNAKTEYLLSEVVELSDNKYFPDALYPLVLQEFADLKIRYGWGENIYYFLSATYGIHPTYIQEMLSGELYDTEQILSAINFLKESSAHFYNLEEMLTALIGVKGNSVGKWTATNWLRGRDVLILAPGPGLNNHLKAIHEYIKIKNPVVLCLNINESVPEDLVTAYVACHETRILIESDRYCGLKAPIILPIERAPQSIKDALTSVEVYDYGLSLQKNTLEINSNGVTLSNSFSLFYAVSIATASCANKILIAGADGYSSSDPRYEEVVSFFKQYSDIENAIRVIAITETTYPIEQMSIYDPAL